VRSDSGVSRRQLLKKTALGPVAGAAFPYLIPSHVLGKPGQPGANDRIQVGFIGVGTRANLLIDQLPESGRIVAVSDCYLTRCDEAASKRKANWRTHQDYRRLLDQKDIDGVVVATNEHWHVLCAMHACMAGKDVYVEKPLSLYVEEGRALVRAARKLNRVVQVGSQQRSMAMNRLGCDFVRSGGLGPLAFVQGKNYTSPRPPQADLPAEPVPETLDWDIWVGQAPMRPYNRRARGGWDFGGGDMTNWGAHGLDQVQSALGMDQTGPVEFWLITDGVSPKGSLAFRYANGVTVRLEVPTGDLQGGAIFVGEKGRIEIIRNMFRTDPPQMVKKLPPPEEVQKWRDEVALWQAKYHMQDWLECMRTRKTPLGDVEIGHRSVTVCHLANITRRLGRKLTWNPETERFIGDEEANGLLTRPRRKGYELPVV
jgi:predicted dehydrogenase